MITLKLLLEQHPEWANLPLKVFSEKDSGRVGGSLHVDPMMYHYVPDNTTILLPGEKDVECVVISAGD